MKLASLNHCINQFKQRKILFLKYSHTSEKAILVQQEYLKMPDHLTPTMYPLIINRYTWLDNQPGVNQ